MNKNLLEDDYEWAKWMENRKTRHLYGTRFSALNMFIQMKMHLKREIEAVKYNEVIFVENVTSYFATLGVICKLLRSIYFKNIIIIYPRYIAVVSFILFASDDLMNDNITILSISYSASYCFENLSFKLNTHPYK